ncbi:MAG: septal ring lytic transglycosylase RlpA family protein [Bacteroidetes bacterium]|nr:septal ring lytic transglycosylase RlpA family protein [Bacteroidota bacterium]
MTAFPSTIKLFSILFLTSLILLLGGCGTKEFSNQSSSHSKKQSSSKKKYSKATQRPYVINGIRYYPIPSAEGYSEKGFASWYGKKFHGRKTSNGETYDMYGNTAAHKTLPMGTILLVKNLENNKSIVVRVNDRGPFVKYRIIDLTHSGANDLGMIKNGTAKVEITALSKKEVEPKQPERRQQPKVPAENQFDKGKFYVQIGAFIEIENARRLARKFADKGRDVIIQQYPAAGMSLYRVLIYGGTSLKKVKQYEKHLEQNGFPNALILAR